MSKINVPLTQKAFYKEHEVDFNAESMSDIKKNLGGFIKDACSLVGISEALEATKIFVESGGKNITRPGSQFIGYTQISARTVADSVWNEFKRNRMSEDEEKYLISLVGATKVNLIKSKKVAKDAVGIITSRDLNDARTNIFLGALYFKQCIDKEHFAGYAPRLDKAIVRYNQGYYYNIPASTSTDSLLTKSIPAESKDYILKMFGSTSPLPYALTIFST